MSVTASIHTMGKMTDYEIALTQFDVMACTHRFAFDDMVIHRFGGQIVNQQAESEICEWTFTNRNTTRINWKQNNSNSNKTEVHEANI